MDSALLGLLIGSFAVLVTTHVALALGLFGRTPRWRGGVALVVPPLAPYWGMEAGMKGRAALWIIALFTYLTTRILAEL
ncbi:MAG: hypothetical protein KF718_28640 [Polyangiaceae bacterium]|nr:hypothetical protein [Polyangiaceae bacterium]